MNIGIITFHRAENYGAVLQAYALQEFISDNFKNCDVKIIDYRSVPIESAYSYRKLILSGNPIKIIAKILLRGPRVYQTKRNFKEFVNKRLVISETFNSENIETAKNEFDCIVAGSDQIFNLVMTNHDMGYFLQGEKHSRNNNSCSVISYAASTGTIPSDESYQSELLNLLKSFDHDVFNSIFVGLMTAFMSVTFLLINPFVELYTSGINDINYIYAELPFMFCVIQILSWSRYISGNLSGVAGYAKPVSVISLIEACSNIILSVVLVKKLGIIGVVAATVISLPIKVVYLNVLADKVIMKRSLTNTAKILVSNWALFGIIVMLKQHLNFAISNFVVFCIYGVILSAIIGIIVLLTNVIINPNLNIYVKKNISRK